VSHRTALWSAAALAIALTLLVGAVLLRPALGADADGGETQVVTLDQTRDVLPDVQHLTSGEHDDWDEDDGHEDDEHEDDDDD
jgi:hypothetical protein